jgi:hypothetical protein
MGKAGDTAKGAAGGAAAGAVLGPWGAAGGALIGGALGYFGGGGDEPKVNATLKNFDPATAHLGRIAAIAPYRAAPTAQNTQLGPGYQLSNVQTNQSRGGMMDTANRIGAIASGQQAGAGELAVNRQVGQAAAAQHSAAMMARGSNAALAYRNAARNTMDIGLAGAGQAAGAQMQDQQAANAQLGSIYGSMYGQDAAVAGQNAQLGQQYTLQQGQMNQQTQLANLQARLAQSGMNDQQQMAAMAQMLGWDQAQVQASLGKAALPAQPSTMGSILSSAGQAAAAYGAYSAAKPQAATGGAYDRDGLMRPA